MCCTEWKPALTGTVLTQRITSIIKSRVGSNISKQQPAYLHRPDVNICLFLKQAGRRAALNKRVACVMLAFKKKQILVLEQAEWFLRVFQDWREFTRAIK